MNDSINIEKNDMQKLSSFITEITYVSSMQELKELIYLMGREIFLIQEKYSLKPLKHDPENSIKVNLENKQVRFIATFLGNNKVSSKGNLKSPFIDSNGKIQYPLKEKDNHLNFMKFWQNLLQYQNLKKLNMEIKDS